MSTIHIFADNGSFFSKKTISVVEGIQPNSCYYFFFNGTTHKYHEHQINESELKDILAENSQHKIVFHSLHDYQLKWLHEIKRTFPQIRIAWVFWSFEYYQLDFNVISLYGENTQKYYWRKKISNAFGRLKAWKTGRVASPLPLNKSAYRQEISIVDEFYAFVPQDGEEVFGVDSKIKARSFSYLQLSDVSSQFLDVPKRNLIMVGHNGSPLVNHKDALDILESQGTKEKILIPLSYGKKQYIRDLKKVVAKSSLIIELQEKYVPLEDYYNMLSSVSVYIQPTRCQQGLGNIVFFLYSGATVYLCKESSTYRFLKQEGVLIKSIEDLKEKGILELTTDEKENNRNFVVRYIHQDRFNEQWLSLIQ